MVLGVAMDSHAHHKLDPYWPTRFASHGVLVCFFLLLTHPRHPVTPKLRGYLDPQKPTSTTKPQEVFGCLGYGIFTYIYLPTFG